MKKFFLFISGKMFKLSNMDLFVSLMLIGVICLSTLFCKFMSLYHNLRGYKVYCRLNIL